MTQQSLFAEPLTNDEQAAAFHAENGWVMQWIVRKARERQARGETKWSVRAAFEELRYEPGLKTMGADTPAGRKRIGNAMSPWFARTIRERYPDIASMFVLGPRRRS